MTHQSKIRRGTSSPSAHSLPRKQAISTQYHILSANAESWGRVQGGVEARVSQKLLEDTDPALKAKQIYSRQRSEMCKGTGEERSWHGRECSTRAQLGCGKGVGGFSDATSWWEAQVRHLEFIPQRVHEFPRMAVPGGLRQRGVCFTLPGSINPKSRCQHRPASPSFQCGQQCWVIPGLWTHLPSLCHILACPVSVSKSPFSHKHNTHWPEQPLNPVWPLPFLLKHLLMFI